MRYDLSLINDVCEKTGLHGIYRNPDLFAIELAEGIVLCFHNNENEEHCLVEFEDLPWHAHGDFQFWDRRGYSLEMSYVDVVKGLKDGRILVCEHWNDGVLLDRSLVHKDHVDEFSYMDEGDDIRIRWLPVKRNPKD